MSQIAIGAVVSASLLIHVNSRGSMVVLETPHTRLDSPSSRTSYTICYLEILRSGSNFILDMFL